MYVSVCVMYRYAVHTRTLVVTELSRLASVAAVADHWHTGLLFVLTFQHNFKSKQLNQIFTKNYVK